MNFTQVRKVAMATSTILVAGCATAPGTPGGNLPNQVRETFASDDPCSNNARNIGIAGGAILGLIIGNSVGDGKAGARATGALLGGLVGGFIGSDMDRKRCELSKVAKQYNLDMTFSAINANGEVVSTATSSRTADGAREPIAAIGTTVTVRDKEGAVGHFESGSDQLTPRAREYFAAIAAQYSTKNMLEGQTEPKRREEISKQIVQRRIFLIGHTDDTGASDLNASLAERRAKAVASFLRAQGIAENALYFQGAGETLPMADNRTEAGRNANRRVEIVEVADEANFKKYLEARKPDYQFYRPVDVASSAGPGTSKPVITAPVAKPLARPSTIAVRPGTVTPVQSEPIGIANTKPPLINFGGSPYSPQEATIKVSALLPEKRGFSFLSKAYASDAVVLTDCTSDRPRAAGSVKSLRDGSSYKTNEHMPQLFGKTWADNVNGNLVVINRLTILRDGGTPANLPELKVYAQHNPSNVKKPMISEEPRVNSYLVGQGVLYRIFPRPEGGIKCMDLLFATDGSTSAKGGKLVYTAGAAQYVANIKPQVQ